MKNTGRKFIAILLMRVITVMAMVLFNRFPAFFFPVYRNISKSWISLLATVTSFTGAAIWDISLIILLLLFIVYSVYCIIKKKPFMQWLSSILLTVTVSGFMAVNGWMLNHYAPKLSEELNMEVRQYSLEELYDTCKYYLLKAAEYSMEIERDEHGHALKMDFDELAVLAGKGYRELGRQHDIFNGSTVPVKKLSIVGEYLMYNGIVGMFMPVSGEAGVPANVPSVPLGFTMAHEAAHRLGIASEQEANFAAFLACVNSDDVRMIYSGYYSAFGYVFSSLYENDADKAVELIEECRNTEGVNLVLLDRKDTSEAYEKYDSPLQEVSDSINDSYLKAFSVESGIKSYGEVTDYLISYKISLTDQ